MRQKNIIVLIICLLVLVSSSVNSAEQLSLNDQIKATGITYYLFARAMMTWTTFYVDKDVRSDNNDLMLKIAKYNAIKLNPLPSKVKSESEARKACANYTNAVKESIKNFGYPKITAPINDYFLFGLYLGVASDKANQCAHPIVGTMDPVKTNKETIKYLELSRQMAVKLKVPKATLSELDTVIGSARKASKYQDHYNLMIAVMTLCSNVTQYMSNQLIVL